MGATAEGTFQMKEWGETPCCEDSGGALKMTRASAKAAFRGGLEGEGATEHVMMYREDKSATFVGLTRFVGRLEEREGSFVLQSSGTFDPATHTAKCDWIVVPDSGTGDLKGVTGKGSFEAPGILAEYSLEYELK
jgi:hypothetical protein